MYKITKNGSTTIRRTFETYEKARQYLRKLIRSRHTPESYERLVVHMYATSRNPSDGIWDSTSRNPTAYGVLGYKIVRSAAKS